VLVLQDTPENALAFPPAPSPASGAYYYYHAEPSKNMQETVTDALTYWDSLKLPTRHVMYDR
jgi:uncharacterized membrane protein